MNKSALILMLILCLALSACQCARAEYVSVSDGEFFLEGASYIIKSVTMSCDPDAVIPGDLSAQYAKAASWGFNTASLHLRGALLEDASARGIYNKKGFKYLDAHIAAARENGMRLILHMYAPTSGVQGTQTGNALWTDPLEQEFFIALWRTIAEKYAPEDTLLGFSLLGEPFPVGGDKTLWQNLAQRTADAIRTVDGRHILFIERVQSDDTPPETGYITLNDPQYACECHFYAPYTITHQQTMTAFSGYQPNLRYPNDYVYPTPDLVRLETQYDTNVLDVENADYQYWNTDIFVPEDQTANVMRISLDGYGIGPNGYVKLYELAVDRVNLADDTRECVLYLDMLDPVPFSTWSYDGGGVTAQDTSGGILNITGTDGSYLVTLEGADLPVEPGYGYALYAKVACWQVRSGAEVRLRTDFYRDDDPQRMNRQSLESELAKMTAYPKAQGLAVYVGGFGISRAAFANGNGGDQWLRDTFEILNDGGLSYSYFALDDPYFGPLNESVVQIIREGNQ